MQYNSSKYKYMSQIVSLQMEKLWCVLSIGLLVSFHSYGQKKLANLLKKNNTESVSYIYVNELSQSDITPILLDAREKREYQISHLPDALWIGYDTFDMQKFNQQNISKDTSIVVYCSLGIRSENIAEQLIQNGYTRVQNLYGGIFEWKNQGNTVVNILNQPTDTIHAFSKEWSKWLKKGIKYIPNEH